MSEKTVGCARPTGAVIGEEPKKYNDENVEKKVEETMPMVRVGGKAPDFEAPAYHKGKFVNVKLSDNLGKWLLVCFYPGDFTFV